MDRRIAPPARRSARLALLAIIAAAVPGVSLVHGATDVHADIASAPPALLAGPHLMLPPPPIGIPPAPTGGSGSQQNMEYHHGPVTKYPKVYLTLWGDWSFDPSGEAATLQAFLQGLGGSNWLNTVTQYLEDSRGNITNPANLLNGVWNDLGNPVPGTPADTDIAAEGGRSGAHFGVSDPDAIFMVATPTGHDPSGFGAGGYCGWHWQSAAGDTSDPNVIVAYEPYMTDQSSCADASLGATSGITIVAGHEVVESETDPYGNAWCDATGWQMNQNSGVYSCHNGENGDKCAWGRQPGENIKDQPYSFSTGSFPVQPTWSNLAGACVIDMPPLPPPPPPPPNPPGATASTNGQQYVFWKGDDNNLWQDQWDGKAWTLHGLGMGPLGSSPTAAVRATGEVDVLWKGADGNLWEAVWNGSAWAGPQLLGMGPLASAPTATAWGDELDVFWEGTGGDLWEAFQSPTGWHGPQPLGVNIGSTPSAGSDLGVTASLSLATGQQYVFWRGADYALWEAFYNGSSWGIFRLGMGPLNSAPTVAVRPNAEQDVFWEGWA